jgi:hypothetical protein
MPSHRAGGIPLFSANPQVAEVEPLPSGAEKQSKFETHTDLWNSALERKINIIVRNLLESN